MSKSYLDRVAECLVFMEVDEACEFAAEADAEIARLTAERDAAREEVVELLVALYAARRDLDAAIAKEPKA